MKSQVLLVTPELAVNLLSRNPNNRPLSRFNLEFLKSELRAGQWRLTHQGIAIAQDGSLIDGQHRLQAIKDTGISAELLVTTGIDSEVFSVLDTGKKRSGKDVLSTTGAKYASAMASAIRLYLLYRSSPLVVWNGSAANRISNENILNEFEAAKTSWSWCAELAVMHTMPKIVIPSVLGCLAMLAIESDHCAETIEAFAGSLRHGAGLAQNDPIHAYRQACIFSASKFQSAQSRLADCIKAFNYSYNQQTIKQYKRQPFPPMPQVVQGEA